MPQSSESERPQTHALDLAATGIGPHYFTIAKHDNKQCAQLRSTGNSYESPPSAHSSIAGKSPNCNMSSLASSAQNHIAYIKTFVISRYFEPPSPPCHTSLQKPQPPLPLEAWRHLWTTPKYFFQLHNRCSWYCSVKQPTKSTRPCNSLHHQWYKCIVMCQYSLLHSMKA
jgi:hypothetical protein